MNQEEPVYDTALEQQLFEAIKKCGMSLSELCRQSEVDKGMVSRFTRKERTLTITTAGKVCAVLGLRLVQEAEEKEPQKPPRRKSPAPVRPKVGGKSTTTKRRARPA